MARRAGQKDSDSFDLMLDTICNVFGGIILMAILVVIHTQAGVARIPQLKESMQNTALSVRKVRFEVTRIEQEIEDLAKRKKTVDADYAATVSPHTDSLLEKRQQFLETVQEAQRRLRETVKERMETQKELEQAKGSRSRTDDSVDKKRDELAELKRLLARQKDVPRKKIRLPLSHQSTASNQQVYLVEGSRVYVYPSHCDDSPALMGGKRITPREGAGFAVSPQEGQNLGFLRSLASIRPTRYYVTFFVSATSKSFEAFQILRGLVVSKGFDCGYGPYDPQEGLIVHPGNPPVE